MLNKAIAVSVVIFFLSGGYMFAVSAKNLKEGIYPAIINAKVDVRNAQDELARKQNQDIEVIHAMLASLR